MKNLYWIGAIALILAAAIWQSWPTAEPESTTSNHGPKAAMANAERTMPDQWPPPSPYAAAAEIKRVPLLPIDQSLSARHSLADARFNGDPRTPPIERSSDTAPGPTAAELADPKAYALFEARQNLRVYAAFYQAAQQELPKLRADIERGRQAGIAPEKIAKAEEKARRIESEQANLLKQHPELLQLLGAGTAVKQ